jgi:hypothetical protein
LNNYYLIKYESKHQQGPKAGPYIHSLDCIGNDPVSKLYKNMKTRLPSHKVIIKPPYPRDPGLIAINAGDNRIEVWTCSQDGRRYQQVAAFDNALVQLSGDPAIGKLVLDNYVKMITLRADRVSWC